ncbi:hypothetical protein PsorP6_006823 [Peronosclerospora sorghi]|uniref:Uncharacterized protein n=1 Tax=Peronosclerospora sorghi TaxID=230839 RepID=A0ACC0W8N3_9STRA|nr:hypothetical protein PsorP6_006823 [Peronosclerospora sorghi]
MLNSDYRSPVLNCRFWRRINNGHLKIFHMHLVLFYIPSLTKILQIIFTAEAFTPSAPQFKSCRPAPSRTMHTTTLNFYLNS